MDKSENSKMTFWGIIIALVWFGVIALLLNHGAKHMPAGQSTAANTATTTPDLQPKPLEAGKPEWFAKAKTDPLRPPLPNGDGSRVLYLVTDGSQDGIEIHAQQNGADQVVGRFGPYPFDKTGDAVWCGDLILVKSGTSAAYRVELLDIAANQRFERPADSWGVPSHNGELIANFARGGINNTFAPTLRSERKPYERDDELVIREARGKREARLKLPANVPEYALAWSPDDKYLALWASQTPGAGAGSLTPAIVKVQFDTPLALTPVMNSAMGFDAQLGWLDSARVLVGARGEGGARPKVFALGLEAGANKMTAKSSESLPGCDPADPWVWSDGSLVYPAKGAAKFVAFNPSSGKIQTATFTGPRVAGSSFTASDKGVFVLVGADAASAKWTLAPWAAPAK